MGDISSKNNQKFILRNFQSEILLYIPAILRYIMVLASILGYIRMMSCALPALSTLPAEIKTKHLLNYKDVLRSMYFDRSDEVLDHLSCITIKKE